MAMNCQSWDLNTCPLMVSPPDWIAPHWATSPEVREILPLVAEF